MELYAAIAWLIVLSLRDSSLTAALLRGDPEDECSVEVIPLFSTDDMILPSTSKHDHMLRNETSDTVLHVLADTV
jgi:hypothetical protein